MRDSVETAVIIGAGPAGLTAALELCRRTSIRPIVLEASDRIGGLSCTVCHNSNRMDLGGHRFFSKSDRVMDWWLSIMPLQVDLPSDSGGNLGEIEIGYQQQKRGIPAGTVNGGRMGSIDSADPDLVMLLRPRKSRIYFRRSLFDYPLSLTPETLRNLGMYRSLRIAVSYAQARIRPQRPEKSLEDFFSNRFGRELYRTFFKSYTEKVWGVPCEQIPADWGAQRIKGLSLGRAARHFFNKCLGGMSRDQSSAETSLAEQFLYPKYGPGQLWERVAKLVGENGGEVRCGWRVSALNVECGADGIDRVAAVEARGPGGEVARIHGDYFFSTMPVRDLLRVIDAPVPAEVQSVSDGLQYRDFIVVGLLVDRLLIAEHDGSPAKDTWIYIHEPDVLVGRVQIMNNWSPHMVADPAKTWIGLEYFCSETEPLWNKSDAEMARFAIEEAASIGLLNANEVRDACVFRVPKAYPAYFGTYPRFDEIVRYADRFENLFLIGRNGMHRYNNQDHSMLTAMVAVDNILAGVSSKENLWAVNTDPAYQETDQDQRKRDRVDSYALRRSTPAASQRSQLPQGPA